MSESTLSPALISFFEGVRRELIRIKEADERKARKAMKRRPARKTAKSQRTITGSM